MLKQIILESIKRNPMSLEGVPEKYLTEELCYEAIKIRGDVLDFIPKKFHSKRISEEAMRTYPLCIENIPKKYLTKEICISALRKSLQSIRFIPKKILKEIGE